MAPFRFSLEQVLRYRRQLEEQAMLALAQATARRDKRLRERDECAAAIMEQRAKLADAALDVDRRWLISGYIAGLTQDLEQARLDLRVLEEDVDRCRADLTQKAQDRKLLEKLKARQAARHEHTEKHQEQKNYDDIATIRFSVPAL